MKKNLLVLVLLIGGFLISYSQPTNIFQPDGNKTILGIATTDSLNYYVDYRPAFGEHRLTKIDANNNATTMVTLAVEPITTMIFNQGKGIYPSSALEAFTLFDGTTQIPIPQTIMPLAGYTSDVAIGTDYFHKGNFTYFRTSDKIYKTDFTSLASILTLYSTKPSNPKSSGIREMYHTQNSIIFQDGTGDINAGTFWNHLKRLDLGSGIVSELDSIKGTFIDRGVVYNNDFYYCTTYGVPNGSTYKVSDNGTKTTLYTENGSNIDINRLVGVTPNGPIAIAGDIKGKQYVVISGGNAIALNHNTISDALPNGGIAAGGSRTTSSVVYFETLDTLQSVNGGNKALWVTDGTLAGTKKVMGGAGFHVYNLNDAQFAAHFSAHCGNDLYFEGIETGANYHRVIYVNGSDYSHQSILSAATPREFYNTSSGISIIANPSVLTGKSGAVFKVSCSSTVSGIKEPNLESIAFFVFPNPANRQITVSLSGKPKNYRLKVYNLLGENVYSQSLKEQSSSINLNLKSGLYFVNVQDESGNKSTRKLIIQ